MIKPIPTFDPTNAESLNKFLLGTLSGIRRKEIAVEEAHVIAKISDKIIKLNLARIINANRNNNLDPIDFFTPTIVQITIDAANGIL